jgi:hypothetical protein
MRRVDELALTMPVALHQDGQRPVGVADALDLVGHQLRRLVPRNAHVLALAPVLRVPLAFGIPVDPPEGVLDPVG